MFLQSSSYERPINEQSVRLIIQNPLYLHEQLSNHSMILKDLRFFSEQLIYGHISTLGLVLLSIWFDVIHTFPRAKSCQLTI